MLLKPMQVVAPPQQAVTPTPVPQITGPAETYRALRSQRDVLGEQRNNLENRRSNLVQQLNQQGSAGPATLSMQKRIEAVDVRLIELDKQIAATEVEVAKAAGVPVATIQPPRPPQSGPPEEVYALGALFMFIVFLPLSIAYARRVWRKAARVTVSLPPETDQRIAMIERGVEAVAVEVERIGEGQRFVTQILAARDPHALGAGTPGFAAQQRQKVAEERR